MTNKSTGPATHKGKIEIKFPNDESPRLESLDEISGAPAGDDFDMRIAADGTWYHEGRPIRRKPLVKLFSTVLRRDGDGVYWLQTPVEKGRIEVEDAPFTAVEFLVSGGGQNQVLRFRTNLDDEIEADSEHPIRVEVDPETEQPRPYILVREGLEALILRSVFYQLVEIGVEEAAPEGPRLGVWSKGCFFPLGPVY